MKRDMKRIIFLSILVLLLHTLASFAAVNDNSVRVLAQATRAALESAIQQYVQSRYVDSQIRVELLFLPDQLPHIRDGAMRVSCRKRGDLVGRTLFTVSYQNADGTWHSLQVWAAIRRYQSVLVLTRSIPKHHVITPEDIKVELREAIWPRNETPAARTDVIGKRSKRRLSRGRILTLAMIESVPLIERGQRLNMHVVMKNLSIIIPTIAYESGGKGDMIKVKNPKTKKFYRAQIIDAENVLLKN